MASTTGSSADSAGVYFFVSVGSVQLASLHAHRFPGVGGDVGCGVIRHEVANNVHHLRPIIETISLHFEMVVLKPTGNCLET